MSDLNDTLAPMVLGSDYLIFVWLCEIKFTNPFHIWSSRFIMPGKEAENYNKDINFMEMQYW